MECIVPKKLATKYFHQNLVGTKACYISETASNEQYSTHEILSYPLNCVHKQPITMYKENKGKKIGMQIQRCDYVRKGVSTH